MMELIIDESKMKALLKDTLIEMMQNKKGIFYKIVAESIEEIGLANAIKAGRKNKFVNEAKIVEILKK